MVGGSGADLLTGDAGNDIIVGGSIRLDTLIGRYESAPGVASTYDHNNNNDGSTEALRLQDARYQGASHRVAYDDTLGAGLLDNAALGTQAFDKHFTEMLRTQFFKDNVLGDGGADATTLATPDIALFTGRYADYRIDPISFQSANEGTVVAYKVTDLRDPNGVDANGVPIVTDGTDLVVGVELLRFSDRDVSLVNAAPILKLHAFDSGAAADNFASGNYAGGSNWTGSWGETGDNFAGATNGSATAGQIRVGSQQLQFTDNADGATVQRVVNLAGVQDAKLSFTYTQNSFDNGDFVRVLFTADATAATPVFPRGRDHHQCGRLRQPYVLGRSSRVPERRRDGDRQRRRAVRGGQLGHQHGHQRRQRHHLDRQRVGRLRQAGGGSEHRLRHDVHGERRRGRHRQPSGHRRRRLPAGIGQGGPDRPGRGRRAERQRHRRRRHRQLGGQLRGGTDHRQPDGARLAGGISERDPGHHVLQQLQQSDQRGPHRPRYRQRRPGEQQRGDDDHSRDADQRSAERGRRPHLHQLHHRPVRGARFGLPRQRHRHGRSAAGDHGDRRDAELADGDACRRRHQHHGHGSDGWRQLQLRAHRQCGADAGDDHGRRHRHPGHHRQHRRRHRQRHPGRRRPEQHTDRRTRQRHRLRPAAATTRSPGAPAASSGSIRAPTAAT
ncbi:hypothetical protein ACVWZV_009662 [Bradyrhizobium sp. GM5.1]